MGRVASMRIALEITSRCNMACAMCGHPSITREKADMTWNRFTRLVSEIQSAGHSLRSIQWFGEPLLAENFVAAVSHLAREGVAVTNAFYTNAMLLIPEMTDRLADVGFAKVFGQTNKVWLSVDSMDPEVYSQIRCGGDFETVASNTQYFCDMLADSLIGVGVQRMITRLNPDEPEEPFERFGVPVFTRYAGRHCDKARDLTVKPFHRDRRPECREMWDTLYIAQDGRAT